MKNAFGCSVVVEKQKPYIVMIIVQSIYAGMAIFSKSAISRGMNPYIFVAYRQGFATVALIPMAIFLDRGKAAPLSYIVIWKIFIVSLIGITLSLNLYSYAMTYTSASFASATTNTIPALTFFMAIVSRMESVSIRKRHGMAKVMGSLIGVCGALVFAFVKGPQINFMNWSKANYNIKETPMSSSSGADQGHELVKGSLIMILSNIIWSSWLIMLGPLLKEYPAKARLTTLQSLFSFLQASVFAFAMDRRASSWRLLWDINLFSVAYCGVVVTGFSYWLQLWVIEKKGPVFIAMFTPLALIITVLFSAIAWKEVLQLGSVCGAILLVGGLYCVLWGKSQEAKSETEATKCQKLEPNAHRIEAETVEIRVVVDNIQCTTHQS